MNIKEKAFFVLAIVFLVLTIVILPLRMNLQNESYYYSQFEKNEVSVVDKEEILDNLLNFFKGKENLEYFEDDEKSHLEDVRVLLHAFFAALYFSVLLVMLSLVFLFYFDDKEFKERVPKILFLGGLCSFAILALLAFASFNFAVTFDGFHRIFFPQGNYAFTEGSLLITLFPAAFFKSFFTKLLLTSVIISFIVMAPQIIINKRKK